MDNGSDAAILQGDKVTVVLGGKTFVFSEPVRRKARIMRAESMPLITPFFSKLPEEMQEKLLNGKADEVDKSALAESLLGETESVALLPERILQFLARHITGLSDSSEATNNATDEEISQALKLVMQVVNRVYLAKKNGADAA